MNQQLSKVTTLNQDSTEKDGKPRGGAPLGTPVALLLLPLLET